FGDSRRDLFRFQYHIAVLRGLVALDLIFATDRLAGSFIDIFPAHTVAGLAIDDVEGDTRRTRRRRIERDGTGKLPDAEMAFPDSSRHGASFHAARPAQNSASLLAARAAISPEGSSP